MLRNKNIVLTASTGVAAINIGGCTLHQWAGTGFNTDKNNIAVSKSKHKNWKNTDVLIIDEVSLFACCLVAIYFLITDFNDQC
jgi:ATP-dependent DNA helicase PIF1